MKKNAMLKIAAGLMVAVLLTTCAISSTFAKYTASADGTALSATVANWDLTITPAGEGLFKTTYDGNGDTSVVGTAELVAPGTTGTGTLSATVTGSSEVAFSVNGAIVVALENWGDKCPLQFKIGSGEWLSQGSQTIDQFEAAIAAAAEAQLTTETYAPGTYTGDQIKTSLAISWQWEFSVDDELDTELGEADTKGTVTITPSFEAVQVDTYTAS